MNKVLAIFVLLSMIISCVYATNMVKLSETKIEEDRLEISFWGIRVDETEIIQKIIFSNNNTEIEYEPEDKASLLNIGYFKELLSPNKKYVVLPLGPFDGFCVFSIDNIVNDIKLKRYYEKIKVSLKSTSAEKRPLPDLYHEFIGWTDNSSFSFRVGLSRDFDNFIFNIDKRQLEVANSEGIYQWIDKNNNIMQIIPNRGNKN